MKVLERKEWEKEFSHFHTCTRCESRLLIEANDLIYSPADSDPREGCSESFLATCAVCKQSFYIDKHKIPEFIKHLARTRARR